MTVKDPVKRQMAKPHPAEGVIQVWGETQNIEFKKKILDDSDAGGLGPHLKKHCTRQVSACI